MEFAQLFALDRITDITPGRHGQAVRNIPGTLVIFDSHFPRFPVLPGVLVIGTLGELAARVLRDGDGRTWRLAGAEQVRFRHFIRPGDQMALEVDVSEIDGDGAVGRASVKVDGRAVTTVRRLLMTAVDAGEGTQP